MAVDAELLRKSSTFGSLSQQQHDEVAGLLKTQIYPAGSLIVQEGAPGETMYFLEQGTIHVETFDATGTKYLRDMDPNHLIFGEVAVLSTQSRRSATLRAHSEVIALELHQKDVSKFLEICPELALPIMTQMAHRIETLTDMLHHTSTSSTALILQKERSDIEERVETLVGFVGNPGFLLLNIVGVLLWLVLHWTSLLHWDSTFLYLGLFLSFEALIVTILVLSKQNRDEIDANRRNDIVLDKVQLTPQEIRQLREQMQELTVLLQKDRQNQRSLPQ